MENTETIKLLREKTAELNELIEAAKPSTTDLEKQMFEDRQKMEEEMFKLWNDFNEKYSKYGLYPLDLKFKLNGGGFKLQLHGDASRVTDNFPITSVTG